MTNLQKSFLVILLHLGIVFLLGWADLGQENILNLGSGFYILVLVSVLVTLSVPILRKASVYISLAAWTAVYLIYRVAEPGGPPLIGGIETYHSMVEIAILSISVYLAYEVSRNLLEVEQAIAQITIPDLGTRVLSMREAGREIASEFVRARRHDRPMALVVIEPEEGAIQVGLSKVIKQIQQEMLEQYMLASIAQVIGEEARRIDLILKQDERGRFAVLCPETQMDGSINMAKRIQKSVRDRLGVAVRFGAASFPDQALTFEEIMVRAETNLSAQGSEDVSEKESL